jgi:hypothetical protein
MNVFDPAFTFKFCRRVTRKRKPLLVEIDTVARRIRNKNQQGSRIDQVSETFVSVKNIFHGCVHRRDGWLIANKSITSFFRRWLAAATRPLFKAHRITWDPKEKNIGPQGR